MSTTKVRVTRVREFQGDSIGGRPRRHVLAIYDTGQVRILIDRGERMATRLLAVLNDGQEHECLDGPSQIIPLCEEYIRHYLRVGGPLACRLSREHLLPAHRRMAPALTDEAHRQEAAAIAQPLRSPNTRSTNPADKQGLARTA